MRILLALGLLIVNVYSFAQTPCASHIQLRNQINTAENPLEVLAEIEALKAQEFYPTKSGNTIVIPVVFHIIHNGDAIGTNENLSDESILNQLQRMNTDFAGNNIDTNIIPSEFKPFFAHNEIQFCLAKKDPFGNFSTGIERYVYPNDGFDIDSINDFIKPQTIWNRNLYLNIWTCAFSGFLDSNLVNGFATPPLPSTSEVKDGIVLRFDKVGNDIVNNIGRTATHEIGHWLGLFHIWGDDNGACTGDDGIADTPNQGGSYFNCPSSVPNSCGSNDMYVNYMDYTDAACALMFTEGQKTKMHGVLHSFRDSLAISDACNVKDLVVSEILSPSPTVCQEKVLPVIKISNYGNIPVSSFKIELFVNDVLQDSIIFNTLISAGEEKQVIFNKAYDFNSNINQKIKFKIISLENNEYDLNNTDSLIFTTINTGSGLKDLLVNDFEDTNYPPQYIFIENPNNDLTWEYYANATETQLFFIDNYNNSEGNIDAFTTTDYNFNSGFYSGELLSFEYDSRKLNGNLDKLTVYYSLDCGANWVSIWNNDFQNHINQTSAFFPNASLQIIEVPLQNILNGSSFEKIRFKFENISKGGNNTFIDNIQFVRTSELYDLDKEEINIYPNPATNTLNFSIPSRVEYEIELFNNNGKSIVKKVLNDQNKHINISEFANGIYFVHLYNKSTSEHYFKKIILQK